MPPLAFLHIPKTAGTSIRAAMQKAIGHENCYVLGDSEPWQNFRKSAPSLGDTPVLAGHFSMTDLSLVPGERKIFTILRDPVSRIISYYGFLKRRPNTALHSWTQEGDMHSFLERACAAQRSATPVPGNWPELFNGMCRRLHPDATAEAALSVIRERGILVLDQSKLSEQRPALEDFIGMRLDVERENVTPPKHRNPVPESVRARIAEMNHEDIKLVNALT
jgi:hypothetical protein